MPDQKLVAHVIYCMKHRRVNASIFSPSGKEVAKAKHAGFASFAEGMSFFLGARTFLRDVQEYGVFGTLCGDNDWAVLADFEEGKKNLVSARKGARAVQLLVHQEQGQYPIRIVDVFSQGATVLPDTDLDMRVSNLVHVCTDLPAAASFASGMCARYDAEHGITPRHKVGQVSAKIPHAYVGICDCVQPLDPVGFANGLTWAGREFGK